MSNANEVVARMSSKGDHVDGGGAEGHPPEVADATSAGTMPTGGDAGDSNGADGGDAGDSNGADGGDAGDGITDGNASAWSRAADPEGDDPERLEIDGPVEGA
ncbi:MAG: hypothetical protein M1420_02425 [Actinobacteria bacterium]|jgi:hypothetical protein|nr:hypothetical protein [Actinomycetota bacterium]